MALGDHNYKGSKNNSSNDGAKWPRPWRKHKQ
jgi:hypothetical protein